jgi:hypothetical protein
VSSATCQRRLPRGAAALATIAVLALATAPAGAVDQAPVFTAGPTIAGQAIVGGQRMVLDGVTPLAPSPAPAAAPPPAPTRPVAARAAYLQPFPVVRIRGYSVAGGTRIVLLSVRGPRSARVTAKCTGRMPPP